MKKLISLVLIVALMLTAFGCNNKEEPKELAIPQNVNASEEGVITWDAVENATGYVVKINSEEHSVATNSYTVSSVVEDFTYSVRATAQGYVDSPMSVVKTFVGTGIEPEIPMAEINVSIAGPDEVVSGKEIFLARIVESSDASVDKAVTWEVVEGNDVVVSMEEGRKTIDGKSYKGITLKVKEVEGDKLVRIKCTSKANSESFAEKIIRVVSRPDLTQEMLDAVANQTKISFDGYMNIELYKVGSVVSKKPEKTVVTTLKTSMDGERWYAEYETGLIDQKNKIYYKNHNNLAQQVSVNLMNTEEYFPMKEDDGSEVSWADSGLYNNFKGLKVEDFKFDEETWQWTYNGSDAKLAQKMASSANPYDFEAIDLSLLIDDGEILGISSKSKPSLTVQAGYRAEQQFFVAITTGDQIEVPLIQGFEHKAEHDMLNEAINNMRALKNYTLDFTEVSSNLQTHQNTRRGYRETITNGLYCFTPFQIVINDNNEMFKTYTENSEYGFKTIEDGLYNTFYRNPETKEFSANRAYKGSIEDALPKFQFAGEIFSQIGEKGQIDGDKTMYMVYPQMMNVASMFYNDPDSDLNMYGLFANVGSIGQLQFTPFVFVKEINGKPYITDASFYFNLGIINGVIEIAYSNFETTSTPSGVNVDFAPRKIATTWTDSHPFVILGDMNTPPQKEDEELTSTQYFAKMFKTKQEDIPCFDNVLGDAFVFGITKMHNDSNGIFVKSTMMFYKVPLDIDFTINSSLKKVGDYLISLGFTKNKAGEYKKLTATNVHFDAKDGQEAYNADCYLVIKPMDEGLDLNIYVWEYFEKK